ncbi:MAG: ion channel [Bacteroidia bacterium]
MDKPEIPKDLGFGTGASSKEQKLINNNGSFNVNRIGQSFFESFHIYHYLINQTWRNFIFLVLLFYTVANFIFAILYLLAGIENLAGVEGNTFFEKFYDAIFFSAQTLTTVGYGRISPVGFSTNLIAAIESLFGVISFALLTGICFGKFSRPSAKILFSKNIVVAPYKNANALMFRLVNARKNQFIESEIQVVLALNALKDGERKRVFYRLNLEIEKINFFPLPWTIVHPIDEKSPLNNMQIKEFEVGNPEISIMFKSFDDTFHQNVYARFSYIFEDIVWGKKFEIAHRPSESGQIELDLNKFNNLVDFKLNKGSFYRD